MFSWLVDHAGQVYLFLGIRALVLGCLWWMSRDRRYLIGLSALAVLFLLVWFLTLFVVTDRMEIARTVETMAQAVDQRNLDQFFAHVSSRFDHQGMNSQRFREYVETQLQRFKVSSFRISKIVVEDVSRQAATGNAEFWIYVEGPWEGEAPPLRCEGAFVLEEEKWRLKGFKLFLGRTSTELRLP